MGDLLGKPIDFSIVISCCNQSPTDDIDGENDNCDGASEDQTDADVSVAEDS